MLIIKLNLLRGFEWIVIVKLQRVSRVVACSFLFIIFLLNYTVGELVGKMVTLSMNTVVSKSLLISEISLPVHNFSIRTLLSKITMMILVYK